MKNRNSAYAQLALMMLTGGFGIGDRLLDRPKRVKLKSEEARPCANPSCKWKHNENGGYCSAKCCKDHRKQLKMEKINA